MNIAIGILFILIGIYFIFKTYRFPAKNDYGAIDAKGYMAGFGSILIGYLLLSGEAKIF